MKFPMYMEIPIDAEMCGGRGSSLHIALVTAVTDYLADTAGKGKESACDICYIFAEQRTERPGSDDLIQVRMDDKHDMRQCEAAMKHFEKTGVGKILDKMTGHRWPQGLNPGDGE